MGKPSAAKPKLAVSLAGGARNVTSKASAGNGHRSPRVSVPPPLPPPMQPLAKSRTRRGTHGHTQGKRQGTNGQPKSPRGAANTNGGKSPSSPPQRAKSGGSRPSSPYLHINGPDQPPSPLHGPADGAAQRKTGKSRAAEKRRRGKAHRARRDAETADEKGERLAAAAMQMHGAGPDRASAVAAATAWAEPAMNADWTASLDTLLRELLRQITPVEGERLARIAAFDAVATAGRRAGLNVKLYGSARTGVILPDSDVDVCAGRGNALELPAGASINVPRAPKQTGYRNPDFVSLLREVRRSTHCFDRVVPVAHARVPIIKFRHRQSNVEVDVSFTADGIATSDYLLERFDEVDNALARPLVVLVKLLLRKWQLHDPKEGGVGSFVVSLMVLWYLRVAARAGACVANVPGAIARHLVGFLFYFGEQFPFKSTAIDVAKGTTFGKPLTSELHLVNPKNPGHNAAAAASRFGPSVRPRFQQSARQLAGAAPKGQERSPSASRCSSPTSAMGTVFGAAADWKRWARHDYEAFKEEALQLGSRGSDDDEADADSYSDSDSDGGYGPRGGRDPLDHPEPFFRQVIVRSPHLKPSHGPRDGRGPGKKRRRQRRKH